MLLEIQTQIKKYNEIKRKENKKIIKQNIESKKNSNEEKVFNSTAITTFYLNWNKTKSSSNREPNLGNLITKYLEKNDATSVALTCKRTYTNAKNSKENYIKKSGHSFQAKELNKLLFGDGFNFGITDPNGNNYKPQTIAATIDTLLNRR
ncbi:hypothetical protein N9L02_01120 [Gammaproteobacteria bacterium]|nr:hypothetical protein [Gammaproteobacteria bacterium]